MWKKADKRSITRKFRLLKKIRKLYVHRNIPENKVTNQMQYIVLQYMLNRNKLVGL